MKNVLITLGKLIHRSVIVLPPPPFYFVFGNFNLLMYIQKIQGKSSSPCSGKYCGSWRASEASETLFSQVYRSSRCQRVP